MISRVKDIETQALLEMILASPIPLGKTALIRRSQRTGIHLLDSRLRRLVNLSLIEELTRDSAGRLGAEIVLAIPGSRDIIRFNEGRVLFLIDQFGCGPDQNPELI